MDFIAQSYQFMVVRCRLPRRTSSHDSKPRPFHAARSWRSMQSSLLWNITNTSNTDDLSQFSQSPERPMAVQLGDKFSNRFWDLFTRRLHLLKYRISSRGYHTTVALYDLAQCHLRNQLTIEGLNIAIMVTWFDRGALFMTEWFPANNIDGEIW